MHGVPGSDSWDAPKNQPGTSEKERFHARKPLGSDAWDAPKHHPGSLFPGLSVSAFFNIR